MSRRVAAVLVLLCACGRPDSRAAAGATRDSAGVRIVELHGAAAALDRHWGLQAVPELTTRATDGSGEIELFRVQGVHRLPDGRLLIANGGTGELLLLDPRTRGLRRYGRAGRGPGEFLSMAGLWPGRGDTAWVYDIGLARVTPFTAQGGFGSPIPVPGGVVDALITLRGRFADGSYLAAVVRGFTGHELRRGAYPDSMTVARVTPGAALAPLARLPFGISFVRGGGITSVPFTAGGIAAAWSGGYFLGETGRYELRRYGLSGRLEMVVRRDVSPLPVTRADVDREIASWTEDGRTNAAEVRRLFSEMPIPRHFPVMNRVVASADGGVWIQDHPGGDEGAAAPWTGFDRDGRIVGRVTLPRGTRIVEVAGDRLAAVATDIDEVEHVVLYRLRPVRR